MQSAEASEAVDAKDMNLSADGNLGSGAVDPPLETGTAGKRPGTPPTDFSKFPFKFKGRSDTFGKGHQIPDPNQQKVSVSTKPRRQGTTNSNKPGDSKKPQSTNDPKSGGQGN